MCIIAIKTGRHNHAGTTTIENMWYNNRDGAGLCMLKTATCTSKRRLMTLKDFKAALKRLEKTIDVVNTPLVLHFRITTHGGTSPGNTHPFPVTEKIALLQMTKTKHRLP